MGHQARSPLGVCRPHLEDEVSPRVWSDACFDRSAWRSSSIARASGNRRTDGRPWRLAQADQAWLELPAQEGHWGVAGDGWAPIALISSVAFVAPLALVAPLGRLDPLSFAEATDVDGEQQLAVETRLYGIETIFRACYAFSDRCYLFLREEGAGRIVVVFRKRKSPKTLDALIDEFANELISQRVRVQVAEETKAVRAAIVAQAFGEADL